MENRTRTESSSLWGSLASKLPGALLDPQVRTLIEGSLREDLGVGDIEAAGTPLSQYDVTAAAILLEQKIVSARIFAKAPGVLAGLPLAQVVFKYVDPTAQLLTPALNDGELVSPGQTLALVSGPVASLLAAERTALNFLGRMSGVATLTRQYVQVVAGTGAVILDTRKTIPGWRVLDKYAVRMGGGQNHRMGLYDMVLIKNNHIDAAGGIQAAVERVRQTHGDRFPLEVEVRDLVELSTALSLNPDRILLDNFSLDDIRRAVALTAHQIPLEASGNVTLETVRAIAETGVDFISSGALTHSAKVLDISMHVEK